MSQRVALACLMSYTLALPPPATAGEPQPALTPAEAEALVREVSAAVEKIRHLKFKTPVKMQIIDGATARENFKAKVEPVEEAGITNTQHAYAQLGLIPPTTNLLSDYYHLAEKGVLGYYEPGSQVFYLLSHVSADQVKSVMAHELTHALEDQHYDLSAVAKKANGEGDRAIAITAVIEGSATAVQIAYLREVGTDRKAVQKEVAETEAKRAERLKRVPSYTQRSVILPYVLGITFLLRGKPWELFWDGVQVADIEQAYQAPPRGTRQILHPEQYWVGRVQKPAPPPALPDLARILGPGWSKADEGSIGELGLAVLTGTQLDVGSIDALFPMNWTNRAAVGNVNDLYHHYVKGEQRVTVLVTRWESTLDAKEFDEGLVNRGQRVFRYGANVLLVGGDAGSQTENLALAALQGAEYWPSE